jgi:hypothetical protein
MPRKTAKETAMDNLFSDFEAQILSAVAVLACAVVVLDIVVWR